LLILVTLTRASPVTEADKKEALLVEQAAASAAASNASLPKSLAGGNTSVNDTGAGPAGLLARAQLPPAEGPEAARALGSGPPKKKPKCAMMLGLATCVTPVLMGPNAEI